MKENAFQSLLIKRLRKEFNGCIILINDPQYIQGIPDLVILYGSCWAALEVKESRLAPQQPNQYHYVRMLDDMSYASFVYPENLEVVIDELQHTFRHSGSPRFFEP